MFLKEERPETEDFKKTISGYEGTLVAILRFKKVIIRFIYFQWILKIYLPITCVSEQLVHFFKFFFRELREFLKYFKLYFTIIAAPASIAAPIPRPRPMNASDRTTARATTNRSFNSILPNQASAPAIKIHQIIRNKWVRREGTIFFFWWSNR